MVCMICQKVPCACTCWEHRTRNVTVSVRANEIDVKVLLHRAKGTGEFLDGVHRATSAEALVYLATHAAELRARAQEMDDAIEVIRRQDAKP